MYQCFKDAKDSDNITEDNNKISNGVESDKRLL